MDWKYVMLSITRGQKEGESIEYNIPVIFPGRFVHADVAKAMTRVLSQDVPRASIGVVSAGFIGDLDIDRIYGKSESLGLESRPEQDERIIDLMPYLHGIE